jgi:hypothetical protein
MVLAWAGCRSADGPAEKAREADTRVGTLERAEITTPGVLFVKPDHHLGSYDELMVDPVVVTFARDSGKLSSSETRRLEKWLREATARKLVFVDPSRIVTEPGPCVLRMQTAFLDIKLPPLTSTSGSRTTMFSSYGSVILVHELRDSMTGNVVLRYFGRGQAGGGVAAAGETPWSGLTQTFDDLLSALQRGLFEAVPLSRATEGPQAVCQGLIYEKIEGDREE